MTQIETHELTIERTYPAPLERVRKALLDPALVARWFAPGPMTAEVHSLDAVVGGQYEISMVGQNDAGEEERHTCTGVFSKLEETFIEMTFNWTGEPLPNDTVLSYTLEATDDGTKLTLRHTGFPAREAADMHVEGWEGCLAKLPDVLA